MRKVPPPFISMPLALARMRGLPAADKILWQFLRWREREKDQESRLPERTYLARCTGTHRNNVLRGLKRLLAADLIQVRAVGPRRLGRVYYRTLLPQACAQLPPGPPANRDGGAVPHTDAPVHQEVAPPQRSGAPRCTRAVHKEENSKDANSIERTAGRNGPTYGGLSLCSLDWFSETDKKVLVAAFPFGCTQAQMQALMQAVMAAAREGVPGSYMAWAIVWPCEETAPWKRIEHQVRALRKDVAEVAYWMKTALGGVAGYVEYLGSHKQDADLRAHLRSYPSMRDRANACMMWPPAPEVSGVQQRAVIPSERSESRNLAVVDGDCPAAAAQSM